MGQYFIAKNYCILDGGSQCLWPDLAHGISRYKCLPVENAKYQGGCDICGGRRGTDIFPTFSMRDEDGYLENIYENLVLVLSERR